MSRLTACVKATVLICAGLTGFLFQPDSAAAFDRNKAQLFAVLPDGGTHPEGLVVAPNGDVYVATFDGSKKIFVFNENGGLLRTLTVNSSGFLLGLGFHPQTGAFLVIDFGAGKVLRVDPHTGGASDFITLATPTGSGLNALTFDASGNVYVSDSFNGAVWKTGPSGQLNLATPWVQDPLLKTTGDPPFGANGLAFNKAGNILFVANTGNDTIVQIPVSGGSPGAPAVFVNSINGADGLIIDDHDNIWVAANQSDEIVVVDKKGKVLAKLGDFDGLTKDGTPNGLLFPASPDFSRDKKTLFVTNLALDLRVGTGNPANVAIDSDWTAQVKHWTVSKINTQFQALPDK
jgi:DNA-binding beta-propeller fold protein YncE